MRHIGERISAEAHTTYARLRIVLLGSIISDPTCVFHEMSTPQPNQKPASGVRHTVRNLAIGLGVVVLLVLLVGTYPLYMGIKSGGSGCAIAPPYCPGYPMVTTGWLSGAHEVSYGVTCVLATGVCNVLLKNNGTSSEYDAVADGCSVTVIITRNANSTTVDNVNGTNGGPAAEGIPHGMEVDATCTVATQSLALTMKGDIANGCFTVRLVSHPDRLEFACFEGAWA